MEVAWPEDRCEVGPNHTHHFFPVVMSIWRCDHCWAVKWTPFHWADAIKFSASISKMGVELAYRKHLHYKPKTKLILEKLEEIRLLRKAGLDEDVLMKAIAAVVVDNEPRSEIEPSLPTVPNLKWLSPKPKPVSKKRASPREGEWRTCVDCPKLIYIAGYRLIEGKEYRCKVCSCRRAAKISAQKRREDNASNS